MSLFPTFRVFAAALLVFLSAMPGASGAQAPPVGSIGGTVVDSVSGLPVVAARVRIVELHREEITHEDGTFDHRGLRPATYTLQVQRLGYRLVTRRVAVRGGDTVQVRITMAPAAVTLAPSIVTGTLSERGGEQVLSPTASLSGAELDRNLAGTVAATVAAQPGVSLTGIGPSTARPVIRGLGGDRILILEDGQRPGDMSAMSGDHAVAIDVQTARQIDVVRGPMSLLYGSSALGGVVNVVREEVPASRPEHMHATLTAQGASNSRAGTLSGEIRLPIRRFAVRAEGSIRDAQDVETPLGTLANTQSRTTSAAIGGARVGSWGHVGLAYRFFGNDYGIPGGFVGGHEEGVNIEMRRHVLRSEGELHLSQGPFSAVRLSAALTDYHHVELEEVGVIGTQFDQGQFAGDLLVRHDAVGLFAQGALGGRVQLREIRTGGSLQTPSTDDYNVAGFVVEELGTGKVRLQTGLRFDAAKFEPREQAFIDIGGRRIPTRPRTFGSLSGSLGMLWEPVSDLRLGASVSRAYRTPDFNELYSNGPHLAANSFEVGDPELDDERGLGFDVFARYNRGRLNAEVAFFGNRLTNFIFPSSRGRVEQGRQGGVPLLQFSNEDADFRGAEGRIEWSVTSTLVLSATLSEVRAHFTSERDSIPLFEGGDTTFVQASKYPPLIPPLHGEVGLRYERPNWFAGATARMSDRQDRLGDFETATAGYAVADLSSGFRFVQGRRLHSITLRIDNAFDRAYRNHLSRIKEIMPEPGRNVALVYRLVF
ncbi:MAG TPA: TonB-dependent receptor [Gemmatimonadaceae bacterium]|nr:TonB-dependent receptor [Gemmatimonadaceae bacterium]